MTKHKQKSKVRRCENCGRPLRARDDGYCSLACEVNSSRSIEYGLFWDDMERSDADPGL